MRPCTDTVYKPIRKILVKFSMAGDIAKILSILYLKKYNALLLLETFSKTIGSVGVYQSAGQSIIDYPRRLARSNLCSIYLLLYLIIVSVSCRQDYPSQSFLTSAERLMYEYPDSALWLLEDSVNADELSGKDYADWCLLITQARDKNHIEHISDSLIRIAVEYYSGRNDSERLMLAYYYMGRVSQDLHNAIWAQEYYLKALDAGSSLNRDTLKALIYGNLGMFYTYQGNYELALSNVKKSFYLLCQTRDTVSQSIVLRDIGRVYHCLNQLDSAVYYYRQSLQHASPENRLPVLSELGGVLLDNEEYNAAIFYLQTSLIHASPSSDIYPVYYMMGKLFYNINQLDSADYYLSKSLNSPVIWTRLGTYYYLYHLAKQRKDWKTYALMQEKYDILRDTVEQQTYTEKLQQVQAMYDYQQVEKEAQLYKLNHRVAQYQYSLTFAGLIILLAFLIGYIIYYRNKKEGWKVKERELRELSKIGEQQIVINNQHILELKQTLEVAEEKNRAFLESEQKRIELENQQIELAEQNQELREKAFRQSEIYLEIHTAGSSWIPKKENWNAFMKTVDTAYPDFAANIEKFRPGCKEEEKRLFYLIKSNVSLRVIAIRMCVTPSAITNRRKRIHKEIFGGKGDADEFDRFVRSL